MPEPHPGLIGYSESLAAYLVTREAARTAVDDPDPYSTDNEGPHPSE
ncbi:hypothetical protein ACGFX8_24635 [Streptomyces sp. NPDC048362]